MNPPSPDNDRRREGCSSDGCGGCYWKYRGGRLTNRKRTLLAGMMMMMNNRGVDVVWELILPLNGVDTGTG